MPFCELHIHLLLFKLSPSFHFILPFGRVDLTLYREDRHWKWTTVKSHLYYFLHHICIGGKKCFPSLTLHLNLTSIPRTFISSPSHLCVSLTLFGPLHLADIVNFHSFSSPEVTPWPGYTIRSSLLANTPTRRQTKAVCFFVVLLASIILYFFLPRHFFFSLLSSHPLLQYIFSMVYNEPVCAKKN